MNSLGIDLGTTNCVACYINRGVPETISFEGKYFLPSVIYFSDNDIVVGQRAKNRIIIDPENILSSTKRHMGEAWEKTIKGKAFNAVDSAEIILKHIKKEAEQATNLEFKDVVITVPAYFDDEQRKQTKTAGEKAGFNVTRLLPEPTAAAIAYGLDNTFDQLLVVIDLGGGTFDVSVLKFHVSKDDQDITYDVIAVDGNSQLGGDDFDNAIVSYLIDWINDNHQLDLSVDKKVIQKLKEEAERIKIDLSNFESIDISIPNLSQGINIEINGFSRDKFKSLIQKYLDEILAKINDVLKQANIEESEVNRFLLVGGSCKHTIVQELIKKNYKDPFISPNMDTAVAEGAAIVCSNLLTPVKELKKNNEPVIIFKDVISHSLGIDVDFSKGGILTKKDIRFVPLLKKNTKYPNKAVFIGSTKDKWQKEVNIRVFRGENADVKKNKELGKLKLKISKENIGEQKIPIGAIFQLDENGILTFTAVEMPINEDNQYDLMEIFDQGADNNNIVEFEKFEPLIAKHRFKTEKIVIETI